MAVTNKKMVDITKVASVPSASDYLFANVGSSPKQVQYNTIRNDIMSGALSKVQTEMMDILTTGCEVVKYDDDKKLVCMNVSDFLARFTYHANPDGIAISEGDKTFVVGMNQSPQLLWSKDAGIYGLAETSLATAITQFNGEEATDRAVSTMLMYNSGNVSIEHAPSYCRSYGDGTVLTSGKWWLPSLGELFMIYRHKEQINLIASLFNKAKISVGLWSSTEYDSNSAWYMSPEGVLSTASKTSFKMCVRPVTMLY